MISYETPSSKNTVY